MRHLSFCRQLQVRQEVDVFVAGGGPAGLAAAVTAAREGASVFLAEGQSCFGGMGTAGLLPLFMPFGDSANFLAGGIGREVYDLLWAYEATACPPGTLAPTIRAEPLKRLYDDLVLGSGAHFSLQTQLVAVEAIAGHVTHAVCAGKSGLFATSARVFIDCTGDGDLCAWAGAPFEKGDPEERMMPGTLCSLWAGIDWPRVWADRQPGEGDESRLAEAIAAGVLSVPDMHLPGMFRLGEQSGAGNIGHTFGVDGTDERSLSEALIWGRRLLLEYERYYKEFYQGFEQMRLAATAPLHGTRESRRILGDYVLCLDDFRRRAAFDDEIGRYNYGVDIHAAAPTAEEQGQAREELLTLRCAPGESYGIPYRCLLPRELDNALVAGRCLSADRPVQSSVRVMPGCFITGQAAGLAAALMVERGTDSRGLDVGELQRRLKQRGAFLPNCEG